MRLNEFQAHVVRGQKFADGLVEQPIVDNIEHSIARQMFELAKLAHTVGSDLDTICTEAVNRMPKVESVAPTGTPATGTGNQSEPS